MQYYMKSRFSSYILYIKGRKTLIYFYLRREKEIYCMCIEFLNNTNLKLINYNIFFSPVIDYAEFPE